MTDFKKTDVGVRSDKTVGISSQAYGANIDTIAFNLNLIGEKRPTKVAAILSLYKELKDITPETPAQPDEDIELANEQISKVMKELDD